MHLFHRGKAAARYTLHVAAAGILRSYTAKAGGDRHIDGHCIRTAHFNRLSGRRHISALRNHAGADPQLDAVMTAAVHVFPSVPAQNESVLSLHRNGAGKRCRTEAHAEADLAGTGATEVCGENTVGVRAEKFALEHCVASPEGYARYRFVEAQRAPVISDVLHRGRRELNFGQRQIGSEVIHVTRQILIAESLSFVISSREK